MNAPTFQVLRALERAGDLSLEELAALIPKTHGDHRDFYLFASLITRGFIDDPFVPDGKPETIGRDTKEQLLSWKYFAMSTADQTATYKNNTWSIHGVGQTLKGQRFALSGLGRLYLEEQSTKRLDRALAIGSGILVGIVVALATVLIDRYATGA